jgi:DNA-directed RNA polymerase subunit RPC12/RpoP
MDCPVCTQEVKDLTPLTYKGLVVGCPRCGIYRIMRSALVTLPTLRVEKRLEALDKPEQMLKFRLVPLALEVIKNAGTVQEYRRIWQPIGQAKAAGMREAKEVDRSGSTNSDGRMSGNSA